MIIEIIIFLILIFIVFLWVTKKTSTKPFVDSKGEKVKDSVADEVYLKLGGVKQWVLLRGRNINNPILIFLHGGPGISEHGLFRYYNKELENDFIVVGWDQRGCGKSYSKSISPQSMKIDTFVSDLHELVQYLKKRFGKDKVYLLGKSWGSMLGTIYASRYPDDVAAYIGTGQVADPRESERLGYEFTLEEAESRNNKKALAELENIKFPPGSNIKDVGVERKWLTKFGGSVYGKTGYLMSWVPKTLSVDEYAWPDLMKFLLVENMASKMMWPEIFNTNLFKQVSKLEVPVYFLLGRHDHQVSSKLAAEYFEVLDAPKKELIWFEYSAHNPPFEEAEKFNDVVKNIVKNRGQ